MQHQPETISQRLQKAMREREITATNLAYTLGVSKSSVSDWLKGGGLTLNNVASIAVELNLSLDWLLLGKGSMDLFGPLHPTLIEMQLVNQLRSGGRLSFDTFFTLMQNMARPLLGDDPVKQIHALEMLEKSRTAMAVVHHNGVILDVNEPCLALLGDNLDKNTDVIGTCYMKWLAEEHVAAALLHTELTVLEGRNTHFPSRLQRKQQHGKPYQDIIISTVSHGTPGEGYFECVVFPIDQ